MQNQGSDSTNTAKSKILALAKAEQRIADDELAEVITRRSDDDIVTDDIENLVVALKRSGVISERQMGNLLSQYLNEKHMHPSER